MAFTFFHRPKPKQFHYEPRFYNPDNEKDENGNELSEEEKRENRMHRSWEDNRDSRSTRRSPRTIIWLVVIAAFILYVIGSKAFNRMTTYMGTPEVPTEQPAPSEKVLGYAKDSTGKVETLCRGEIGGPFYHRIDSIALAKFSEMPVNQKDWPAFYAKMKAELGDEYELVRERLNEICNDYYQDDESGR